MTLKKPNFLIVGSAKCGTTSLYHYLKDHPQICLPCKETKFFNSESIKNLPARMHIFSEAEYRQIYRANITSETRGCGEVSTSYLYYHEEAIPRIREYLGDPKIIIILRDPVERAYSNYIFHRANFADEASFEEALEMEETRIAKDWFFMYHYRTLGLYYEQVKAYLDNFSRVKVYLLRDLKRDPCELMRKIYRFLEVDENYAPPLNKKFNASGVPHRQTLHRLVFKPSPVKNGLRDLLARLVGEDRLIAWIHKLRSKNLKAVPMKPATRRDLENFYRKDIKQLQDLIECDLSDWIPAGKD